MRHRARSSRTPRWPFPARRWLGAAATAVLLSLLVACVPATTGDGETNRSDASSADARSPSDLAQANEARLDALVAAETPGTVRVGPHDLLPSETSITTSTAQGQAYDFTRGPRGKAGLELIGSAIGSGAQFCFGTGLELTDGASIVAFSAILADPDGSDDRDLAEAYLQVRPWTGTRADTVARVAGQGGDAAYEVATDHDLPVTVDAAANEYRLLGCLEGRGGFLGGRIVLE